MNTFNIILTLVVPILVIGYIIWDLSVSKVSEHTVKSTKKSEVRKKHSEMSPRGGNNGKLFSRMEILENAKHIIKIKMF